MTELRDAVSHYMGQHEPRREVISGWMADPEGWGDPVERDTNGEKTGYYYCMIDRGDGTNSGDVIKVWGNGARPVAGWPVLIGTTRERPWELSILSIDKEAMGGGIDRYSQYTEPHHETHEWGDPSGSDDVVYPRWLQLYDFSVWPISGTQAITIADGVYSPSGGKIDYPYTTVDLAGYAPSGANTSRWVIVCLDPSGDYQIYACPSGTNLDIEDICSVPDDNWWELAAVKLWQNDSSINMTPGAEEVIDLRFSRIGFPQFKGGGGSATVDWDNLIIVAEGGGDYTSIQTAENARAANEVIAVMPGAYSENLIINTAGALVSLTGAAQAGNTILLGADDTGPMIEWNPERAIKGLYLFRSLVGGSGEFLGIDATNSGVDPSFNDLRIILAGGSRKAVGIRVKGNYATHITDCHLSVTGAAGSACVDLDGGVVYLHGCFLFETGITSTSATDLFILGSYIDGNVVGTGAGTCYIDQASYVGGSISGFSSVVVLSSYVIDHDHTGDTGDGGALTQFVRRDGTLGLTADWDAGAFEIRAETLEADVTTGTAPLTIASTTKVSNLNVDQVDGAHASDAPAATEIPVLNGSGYLVLPGDITVGGTENRLHQNHRSNYSPTLMISEFDDLTGWSWAGGGAPFVTPSSVDYSSYPSMLYVGDLASTGNKAFLYRSISTYSYIRLWLNPPFVNTTGMFSGLRIDDGTDNNYVEIGIYVNAVLPRADQLIMRYRTGGGSVTTLPASPSTLVLPELVGFYMYFTGTKWSSWTSQGLLTPVHGWGNMWLGSTGTLTYTPTRVGWVLDQGSTSYASWHRWTVSAFYAW